MSHAAGILVSQAAGVLRTQLKVLAGAPLVQLAWAAQLARDAGLARAAQLARDAELARAAQLARDAELARAAQLAWDAPQLAQVLPDQPGQD